MQETIFQLLLGKLHMQALLSLDAVLHVIGALARDLQGDFVPLFPRLCGRLADLISAGECRVLWASFSGINLRQKVK